LATSLRPIPPPLTAPMLDEGNMVSRPWADFFSSVFRYQQANNASVADGTYTLGLGSTDGEVTIANGFITAIQEVEG
jgi:hypothetical protein